MGEVCSHESMYKLVEEDKSLVMSHPSACILHLDIHMLVFRYPPRMEHEVLSAQLHHLLACELHRLPVHVLTDMFITGPSFEGNSSKC